MTKEAIENIITVDVTQCWWDDAISRDLDCGEEVSRTAKLVTVRMTSAQHAEALSDAEYYAGASPAWFSESREFLGLLASAKASARRLRAAL